MNYTLGNEEPQRNIRILSDDTSEPHSFLERILEEDKYKGREDESFNCKQVECVADRINCNDDKTICICNPKYGSLEGEIKCGYAKKKQLVAFLLELLVGFGGGHFYTERYLQASFKLVAFLFGIYIICLFPFTAKCMGDTCQSDCGVIITSCFYYLYSVGLASWFIVDLVWFGKNRYLDGHDYNLIPW